MSKRNYKLESQDQYGRWYTKMYLSKKECERLVKDRQATQFAEKQYRLMPVIDPSLSKASSTSLTADDVYNLVGLKGEVNLLIQERLSGWNLIRPS